jgi:solute carrier family 25 S-adenosylmethionine transporter 26
LTSVGSILSQTDAVQEMQAQEHDTPKRPAGGWFSEVGQARSFYKQISLLDRTKIGAMAGGLAGAFTYCCLHPIDTVRTRLQSRGATQVYKSGLDCVVSILRTEGIFGFYSGISAVLVGSMISSAVYFGCIELGRSALVKFTNCSPLLIPPLSGAFGNIVSSIILVPKEVITQRMQAGASGRSWQLALRTIQNEGVSGLYSGYGAALVRNLPSSVLSFTAFEYVKALWLKETGKPSLEPWQSVLSGAMAGAISGALTTPLDVVKTRLMTQAKKEVMGTVAEGTATAALRAKIAASSYKGISSTLNKIWVEEGWVGLTKGMGPRLLHSALFSALGYFAFETARVELVKRHMAKVRRLEADADPTGIVL